jgi:NADH-quinone oxidoreductase subunit E
LEPTFLPNVPLIGKVKEQMEMDSSGNGSDRAGNPALEEPLDLSLLDHILDDFRGRKGAVIPVLQRAQDAYGYLPREVLKAISQKMLIPLNHLYGVATFYAQFRLQRRGRHLIRICDGTACHVRGSGKSIEAVERALRVAPGETSPDYRYTLEIVYCLGSCGLSPVAVVDDRVQARLTPESLVQQLESLE